MSQTCHNRTHAPQRAARLCHLTEIDTPIVFCVLLLLIFGTQSHHHRLAQDAFVANVAGLISAPASQSAFNPACRAES
jgi:hypothetical protein